VRIELEHRDRQVLEMVREEFGGVVGTRTLSRALLGEVTRGALTRGAEAAVDMHTAKAGAGQGQHSTAPAAAEQEAVAAAPHAPGERRRQGRVHAGTGGVEGGGKADHGTVFTYSSVGLSNAAELTRYFDYHQCCGTNVTMYRMWRRAFLVVAQNMQHQPRASKKLAKKMMMLDRHDARLHIAPKGVSSETAPRLHRLGISPGIYSKVPRSPPAHHEGKKHISIKERPTTDAQGRVRRWFDTDESDAAATGLPRANRQGEAVGAGAADTGFGTPFTHAYAWNTTSTAPLSSPPSPPVYTPAPVAAEAAAVSRLAKKANGWKSANPHKGTVPSNREGIRPITINDDKAKLRPPTMNKSFDMADAEAKPKLRQRRVRAASATWAGASKTVDRGDGRGGGRGSGGDPSTPPQRWGA